MDIFDIKRNSQHLALLDELDTSVRLIKLGFGEIQNLDNTNGFYFLPFQLLSPGFERLMKSYICLGYLDKHGDYPPYHYIKDLGHDLHKLLQTILSDYFLTYDKPFLADDRLFLESDKEFEELLSILSDFGKLARYHNLDVITGRDKTGTSPQERWTKFESKIMQANPSMFGKLLDSDTNFEVYGEISRYILIIFEKFMSALGRQFIFDTLGAKGKQFSGQMFDFGMLYPRDFGNTDYRKQTTRFKVKPRKVHRRNIIDYIYRKWHPDYKSMVINKDGFEGDWPFYSDEVVIECRHKMWCIVTIDGKDYALNGAAKGRYQLEDAYGGGMAKVGVPVSHFIQLALNIK